MSSANLTIEVTQENAEIVSRFLLELFPPQSRKRPTPKLAPQAEASQEESEEPKTPDAIPTKITFSDLRERALKLSKAGKQDVLKALFEKHDATKLSEIKESSYGTLLNDLEAAVNG